MNSANHWMTRPDPDMAHRGAQAPKAIIEIRNLSVYYQQHRALSGASLVACEHEILALVGPSGCGKSSLLNSINRMTDTITGSRLEGEIILDGRNVLAADYPVETLRQLVGMVFQQPNPFPLSIRDNIAFPLKDHGMRSAPEREARTQEVLQQVGLWDEVKDRLASSALRLSGGQQQRLCIARALALRPRLLLLDEPCSALDPIATEVIERLIQSLKQRTTIVMVTHNLAQARRIADQVAVCWVEQGSGCVIECNSADAIFERPCHPVTLAYCLGRAG